MSKWDDKESPRKWPYAAQRFPTYYDEVDELVQVPNKVLQRLARDIPEAAWHNDLSERIGNIQVDQEHAVGFGVLSCDDFVRIMKCAGYQEVPLWMQMLFGKDNTMTRKEYFKTHDLSNLAEPLQDELELLRGIRDAARMWRLRRNPAECLELAQALDKYYEGQYGQ